MLISSTHRFVFVANTKCASTAIETALRPYADIVLDGTPQRKHTPLCRLPEICPPDIRDEVGTYLKFGVMREPVDWICSWFRYRKGNQVDAPLPADMNFADFWRNGDWNIERPDCGGKYLQKDMFCDRDGRLLADIVLPYPRLHELFPQLCDRLGVEVELPRSNVSRISERPRLNRAQSAELWAFYAEDYALFASLDKRNDVAFGSERTEPGTALTAAAGTRPESGSVI